MNRTQKIILTYIKMILLFMVLGALVLYLAGGPVVSYFVTKGTTIMVQGAPGYHENTEFERVE